MTARKIAKLIQRAIDSNNDGILSDTGMLGYYCQLVSEYGKRKVSRAQKIRQRILKEDQNEE